MLFFLTSTNRGTVHWKIFEFFFFLLQRTQEVEEIGESGDVRNFANFNGTLFTMNYKRRRKLQIREIISYYLFRDAFKFVRFTRGDEQL